MKGSRFAAFFVIAVCSVITVSAQDKTFKTDAATGVQYRFIKHDAKGAKPADGDVAHVLMLWTGKNSKGVDSVFGDSHKRGGDSIGAIPIPLKKSFNGCLEQGIMMLSVGDSAVFHIKADSLYLKTFRLPAEKLPNYINANAIFTFNIKLVSFQTQQEINAARLAEMQKRKEKAQMQKAQEPADISAYLQKNYPNAKPDADSIFYLQKTKGTGQPVKEGDSLEIKYTGMYLDGKVFDQSDKGVGRGTFKILYTNHVPLIKGWISVLSKMNQGDKVKVLIPSAMGYGSRGGGRIQPYTPLLFDMELVTIIPNK